MFIDVQYVSILEMIKKKKKKKVYKNKNNQNAIIDENYIM